MEYALPALMSEDNLYYATENYECKFIIATDNDSANMMKMSEVIQKLEKLMPVEYMMYDTSDIRSKWTIVRRCNQIIVDEAAKKNAVVVTLGPDCMWSSSCVKEALNHIQQGYRVYVLPGYRTVFEDMAVEIDGTFRDDKDPTLIHITAKELVSLGIKHIHQGMLSWFWDRPDFSCYGTYLSFTVKDQGVLGLCYNGHPLAIWPQIRGGKITKLFDQDYMVECCPDLSTHYIEQDATKSIFFEMSPKEVNVAGPLASATIKIFRMATRFEHFNPVVRSFYPRFPVRFPTSKVDEQLWVKYERKGLRIVKAVEFLNRLPDWIIAVINPPQLFKRQKMYRKKQSSGMLIILWTRFIFGISAIVKKLI